MTALLVRLRRWRVRAWLFAEKRLCGAYDALVDAEERRRRR